MCYMLYLGSEQALPLIPAPDWDSIGDDVLAKAPRLIIRTVPDEKAAVIGHFTEKHAVYAGSYEGCGCGFNLCADEYDWYDDEDDDGVAAALSAQSREALAEYVQRNGVTSLYGCWDGEQHLPKVGEMAVTRDMLHDLSFALPERVMMRTKISQHGVAPDGSA